MSLRLDRKVEGLEASVSADVPQVEHRDVVVLDIADDVGFRELLGLFAEGLDKGIGVEGKVVIRQHGSLLVEHDWLHTIVTHAVRARRSLADTDSKSAARGQLTTETHPTD